MHCPNSCYAFRVSFAVEAYSPLDPLIVALADIFSLCPNDAVIICKSRLSLRCSSWSWATDSAEKAKTLVPSLRFRRRHNHFEATAVLAFTKSSGGLHWSHNFLNGYILQAASTIHDIFLWDFVTNMFAFLWLEDNDWNKRHTRVENKVLSACCQIREHTAQLPAIVLRGEPQACYLLARNVRNKLQQT